MYTLREKGIICNSVESKIRNSTLEVQVFHFKLVLLGDASVGKSCGPAVLKGKRKDKTKILDAATRSTRSSSFKEIQHAKSAKSIICGYRNPDTSKMKKLTVTGSKKRN